MRKAILSGTALLFTISSVFAQKDIKATHYKEVGDAMPPIAIYTSRGEKITNETVKNKANLLVMIFNPQCSHCEDMTALLEKNIGMFNKSKLLMVANSNQAPYIKNFEQSFHIDQYPTISLGLDSNLHYIDKTFRYNMLPQINIYNRKRKLIKVFTGDIVIDSLKPYIQ